MGSHRKIAIAFAVALAVLGIAGIIAFQSLANPERLKTLAREKTRTATGRDLAIGDMALKLQPWPTLHASNVTLADAPGAKDPWQLHADRLEIGIALWPLLEGKVQPSGGRIDAVVGHNGIKAKVVADIGSISHFGDPDATANGKIDLDFGKTRVALNGRFPMQAKLRGASFKAQVDSPQLNDLLRFVGVERPRTTASAQAAFALRGTAEKIEVLDLTATLGKQQLKGDATVVLTEAMPVIDLRAKAERLDWVQLLLDWGSEPRDPLPPDEMFYNHPWAWPMLDWLQGKRGTVEAEITSLRLRNGVELQSLKGSMVFEGDKLQVKRFTTNLLGGSATGTMQFEGRKKHAQVHFEGTNLLLEHWFKERSRSIPFTGGPMAVTATLGGTGNSMREIAGSVSGPMTVRMGPGVWALETAGNLESLMVTFTKKHSAGSIAFECVSADLAFVQGRASGNAIVGARSDVSRLLTSGYISFLDQELDLRGRVQPKPGLGVGFAAIDGDIRISGKIKKPKVSLDPAGTAKGVVRAGVAIATLGLSLAGTAAANAAKADTDPCADVFRTAHTPP